MNPVISRLIVKDWRLHSRLIAACSLTGIGALALVRFGNESARLFGGVWFFVALIVLGAMLPSTAILNERKKQTLAFIMSLPVSSLQYTIAKMASLWTMFLLPWLALLVGAVLFVQASHTIPHGVIPTLVILAMLPVLGFSLIASATLIGESEGALIASSLVCNSSYWFVWYLLARIPSLTDHWKGSLPVWNTAARTVLSAEIGLVALTLAVTLFLQSRKRDFI
jgi:ABC-2 type transport system permease protein